MTRTIGGGVSVEFTGLETVSTKQMATPKSGNAIIARPVLPPLSTLKRKGDDDGAAQGKRGRGSDEDARTCNVGFRSTAPGLGLSVEHKVQPKKKK